MQATKTVYSTMQLGELFSALSKAQGSFRPLKRTAKGHWGKYADLNDIRESTQESLTKNGLTYTQSVADGAVTTVLGHASGQHIIYETSWQKQNIKLMEHGKNWTLMRRYALQSVLGVAGDDDAEKKIDKGWSPVEGDSNITFEASTPMLEAEALVEDALEASTTQKEFMTWMSQNNKAIVDIKKDPDARAFVEQKLKEIQAKHNKRR